MYKLFLDDIRMPYDCVSYMHMRIGARNSIYLEEDWVIVRDYNSFVSHIVNHGLPAIVSFDHDLGPEEEWADVKGYEGLYMVSTWGRVKSLPRNTTLGKILSPAKTESGLIVMLRNLGNDRHGIIHRLVAETFLIRDSDDKTEVNHLDGNRWNNNVTNLEWTTPSENIQHSHDHLIRNYVAYAENHGNSMSVSQYDLEDNLIDVYGSVNEAGRVLNIPFSNIAKCARDERKTAGGFIWRYEKLPITVKSGVEFIPKENRDYSQRFFIPDNFSRDATGYDCAKWLVEYCINAGLIELPEVFVHSMNPSGALNISSLFINYQKHRLKDKKE